MSTESLAASRGAWYTIAGQPGMGLEHQHVLRWSNAPVCSVRRRPDHWLCSCLLLSGVSTTSIELPSGLSLDEVQGICEEYLRFMGWRRWEVQS